MPIFSLMVSWKNSANVINWNEDMKYKDICDLFVDKTIKIRTAVRVSFCKPYVRKAINEWLKSGIEPDLTVELKLGHQEKFLELSAQSLIHDYGLSPLDALLFIDWANRSPQDTLQALQSLRHKSTFVPVVITEEMWKQVTPEVMEEYRKLLSEDRFKQEKIEQRYHEIENREIDE